MGSADLCCGGLDYVPNVPTSRTGATADCSDDADSNFKELSIPRVARGSGTGANPNKHFLIGVLPRLFQDPKLFPSNEDIAEFAQTVLRVPVTRFEKRSKYALIGLIVCQTNELDEEKLSNLVKALSVITRSDEKLKRVVEARREGGLNWNEAIQQISQSTDETRGETRS